MTLVLANKLYNTQRYSIYYHIRQKNHQILTIAKCYAFSLKNNLSTSNFSFQINVMEN